MFLPTAVVGGASIVVILLGIVRTKFLALLLGTSGVGLVGVYQSILEIARMLAGMGVANSGVRQVATSLADSQPCRVAGDCYHLRRICLILGFAGSACLFLARGPISRLTFGTSNHSTRDRISFYHCPFHDDLVWPNRDCRGFRAHRRSGQAKHTWCILGDCPSAFPWSRGLENRGSYRFL